MAATPQPVRTAPQPATAPRPGSAPAAAHPAHQHTARAVGVVGFAAIALIHVLDLPGKLHETPYLGVAYVLLVAGLLVASFLLLSGETRKGWALGGGLAAATLVGYAVNRTIGMPAATDDIGNWLEPLGLASLFVEACMAGLAAWALRAPAEATAARRSLPGPDRVGRLA